jgi:hypothetical protein
MSPLAAKSGWKSVMSRNGFAASSYSVFPDPCGGTVARNTFPPWLLRNTRPVRRHIEVRLWR